MSAKEKWLWGYRVMRSVLFIAVAFVAVLYIGLYVTLSIPAVQRSVRDVAQTELSKLVGSRVDIDAVDIYPFNEVVVRGVTLYQPADTLQRTLYVEKVGAGISLTSLIWRHRIVITYAELMGMKADIWQQREGEPLNIQFLIDAFAPKEKNKPPTQFDLQIRNIVIRKSAISFHKRWMPRSEGGRIDFNHIDLTGLNADVALPRLSNDRTEIDLRRLAFRLNSLFEVKRLSAMAIIDHGDVEVNNFLLSLPNSVIRLNDLRIPIGSYKGDFRAMLSELDFNIRLDGEHVVAAEFAGFFPPLASLQTPFTLSLDATGNAHGLTISELSVENRYEDFSLQLSGASLLPESGYTLLGASNESSMPVHSVMVDRLKLHAGRDAIGAAIEVAGDKVKPNLREMAGRVGNLDLDLDGRIDIPTLEGEANLAIESGAGDIDIHTTSTRRADCNDIALSLSTDGFALDHLLATDRIGTVALNLEGNFSLRTSKLPEAAMLPMAVAPAQADNSAYTPDRITAAATGIMSRINRLLPSADINLEVPTAQINGYQLADLTLNLSKDAERAALKIDCNDENFLLSLNSDILAAGEASTIALNGDITRLHPSVMLPLGGKLRDCTLSGELSMDLQGDSPDTLTGNIALDRLSVIPDSDSPALTLTHLGLFAGFEADGQRLYTLDSDWINGSIGGNFTPSRLPALIRSLTDLDAPSQPDDYAAAPPVASAAMHDAPADITSGQHLSYNFTVNRGGTWSTFFNLPVKLLYEAEISGELDEAANLLTCRISAPYIQQGKNKLIQHTRLDAEVRDGRGVLSLFSSIPTKKGVLDLNADILARRGVFDIDLGFNREKQGGFYGDFSLQASITRALNSSGRIISAHILPSTLYLNKAAWSVGASDIIYADRKIDVTGFSIAHADQYITIGGTASADPEEEIVVKLKDIDLDYIFDTLNINYVAFGGLASGEAVGRGLLSGNPEAFTRRLDVKNLSYNHSVLGDGALRGTFDAAAKRVGIYADIAEAGRHVATIDGGIWIGRDSLSFGIDADKVRIGFLQTFMSAFSSNVEGRASGSGQLYGTFSDIDMRGRFFADSIALKVDYTNVTYCGSDSVIIDPGHITVPSFRLKDRYGNSALLQGWLSHRYFHDPEFNFKITGARHLLVYDTDGSMNPVWYGRVFGTGGGQITGRPGLVGIMADMTTDDGTDFTFVLNDQQEAIDYKFLTFTDKRKAAYELEHADDPDEPDEIVAAFNRKVAEAAGPESEFAMDIRATITPWARLTLVMDPIAGDKIRARGSGAMNLTYRQLSNDLKMYGKYTLAEGTYNFSLQDLILKDFIIKEGSSISFNGDPLNGLLDIRAAYRVNTNLTYLDKSFATDRDLNRTNVPVDAMLIVNGEMTHPDITFDIELPTLNEEVAQKVRSIISSEDMMNKQIIYLLALNRFYTPEYVGSTTTGGEWASVASSTLSSKLTNMLGQLTDKVFIAPSVRSDKGDFSDVEVDVALSSRLFNNRLLINGNFGYRDRTSSSTTFIGDFDIEYLLNRRGNLRLKAYNHFNDQNYYLKSALTTQGVGLIWRRDFDHFFGRRKKREKSPLAPSDNPAQQPADSIPQPADTLLHRTPSTRVAYP